MLSEFERELAEMRLALCRIVAALNKWPRVDHSILIIFSNTIYHINAYFSLRGVNESVVEATGLEIERANEGKVFCIVAPKNDKDVEDLVMAGVICAHETLQVLPRNPDFPFLPLLAAQAAKRYKEIVPGQLSRVTPKVQ